MVHLDSAADPAAVLSKAVVRASDALGLTQYQMAEVLGVSSASASRLVRGRAVDPSSKEGELAILLVRVYRSLDAILGGGRENMRRWTNAPHNELGGAPVALITSVTGLVNVVEYLDAMRGRL